MGLDIYVRWDDMTDEEQNAQYTGYRDSCETGYLRFNWTGVKVCRCIADKTGAPNPIRHLFSEWNGSNGEELFVDDDVMRRLSDNRTQLAEWLRSSIPQEIRLDDFPDENPVGLRQWFVGKVHGAMTMINFVELNKDKPNLRIEFN